MLKMEYLILKVYIIFLWYFLCVFLITVNISALRNKSYFIKQYVTNVFSGHDHAGKRKWKWDICPHTDNNENKV